LGPNLLKKSTLGPDEPIADLATERSRHSGRYL